MESYSSRKFQGLGWAVNSLRARASSQRQAQTAALQDKYNTVALQQQSAYTTRRAGEKSVASVFGNVPMVSAPLVAKFGKQAFQGLKQRGQDLAELKQARLGGRTEAEANYDDDLEETMGKFEDSGIKPEAEGYLEDEDVPGPSTGGGGGTTSAEPASGDFSTANSDLTDDFSGIEPGDGDEVEQQFSLTKGFLGPSNPTEAAQQSTEYSNTFNEGQIDMANDVANELRGLPGGSYTTNASGEFVPMEQEATGFFGRLNSRMGNTLARMGGMEPASESSGVETVDYARASDFDTPAEPAETNTAFETPAEPETDISGYTTSDVGAESTDFGSAPEIPERVSSLSRFGGNADEIGTSLARQQASTGDSTLARLGQSGGSGEPPQAEIVENNSAGVFAEPTASDIEAMPSSSEAGASSSETSGLSGAESAASRVNPDTLTGTIGEESDFGGIGAETGIETGAETGIEAGAEVGAEVAGDAVVEGLDLTAAIVAPVPVLDIVVGAIAGAATLASVGYSIYEAVHSGQQGNAPPPAQIASVPTPQPNIAGHYVGASGENVYNQPQHFQGF